MSQMRCHSVRDMDFRRVPEVQLSHRVITDWEFADSAKMLDFSTFEDLEGLCDRGYKEQLSVVSGLRWVEIVVGLDG